MIDLDTLAVALTLAVLITAGLAGLVGGIAGSLATTWVANRRQRSVAAEAEAVLVRHNRRARLWRGRR